MAEKKIYVLSYRDNCISRKRVFVESPFLDARMLGLFNECALNGLNPILRVKFIVI